MGILNYPPDIDKIPTVGGYPLAFLTYSNHMWLLAFPLLNIAGRFLNLE